MRRAAPVLALAGGLCAVLCGVLAGLGGIAAALLAGAETRVAAVLLAASFSLFGIVLGGALAWQGWLSLQGRPSRPWQPRRTWIAVLLLAGALAAGAWAAGRPPLDLLLLPVAHVLAAALPPAIILALAARGLGGRALRRHLLGQVSSGAFLSVFLAMLAETLLVAGLVVVVLVAASLLPGGQQQLEDMAQAMETFAATQDLASLGGLARSPWLWAGALLVASVAVPLVEESLKTVGVGLMLHRRPGRDEAYLWGMAGGAGFAMVESALNSILGLQGWIGTLLMRIPAGLMHCFTGALMGLAWHAAFVERRRRRALGLFAASVSLHGAWNALAVTSGLLSLENPSASLQGLHTHMGALLAQLLLLVLAGGVAAAFAVVTLRLRQSPRLPESAQPPAPGAAALSPGDTSPDEPVPPAGRP